MSIAAIIQELDQESATTRRVLERVPADKLAWKPHAKSMSLGELALHLAMSPGYICNWAMQDVTDFSAEGGKGSPTPKSTAEILAAHDEGVAHAKKSLSSLGDDGLRQIWTGTAGGATIFGPMPKAALVRAIVMNHTYHHRGQLSVYLRLLDVPVPSIYGPSADEAPAAPARA
jgi:uncharacterized damage-inducible protein DinB